MTLSGHNLLSAMKERKLSKEQVGRILLAMKEKKMSQAGLAVLIGVRQQTIQKILAGKIGYSNQIMAIAHALDRSIDWIMGGAEKLPAATLVTILSWMDIVEYAACTELDRDKLEKNKEKVPVYKKGFEKCKALKINNSLMEPKFKPGDIIFVDLDKTPKDGSFVIAYKKGSSEAMLKKIDFDGGDAYLSSLDKDIPKIKVTDDINIFGVVVYKQPPGEDI